MSENTKNVPADIRGTGRLAIDVVTGITDIVESLHYTILNLGLPGRSEQKRTRGITGLVYRNIRAVTGLIGERLDTGLAQLEQQMEETASSRGREAAISALNGILGDYLSASNNSLAITMQFRYQGRTITGTELESLIQRADGKLVIMVHGLCMNDLQWNVQDHDHGDALASDLGYTPIYLHYNSGCHISDNGLQFSQLLETLTSYAPKSLSLVIVAHSMGGLVSRSACYYAEQSGHQWLQMLDKMVFLGTPHHGSPLEKGGNIIDNLLTISPYSEPFARLGKIRSSGITDLRHGNILSSDWQGRDRFEFAGDPRQVVPLPENVQCFTIAAIKNKNKTRLGDTLIGDGLVTLNSALGRHKNEDYNLSFPIENQWIARDINHMELLYHTEVYTRVLTWLSCDQTATKKINLT